MATDQGGTRTRAPQPTYPTVMAIAIATLVIGAALPSGTYAAEATATASWHSVASVKLVAASPSGGDRTRASARLVSAGSAAGSRADSKCPAKLGFPLCALPLPGFPKAEEEMALAYREIKIRPLPTFGLHTPVETERGIPNHVLQIEYGVENLGYPYSNPCVSNARRVSIRGDTDAIACIEEGAGPVILAALWREMGTTWQVTLSSNDTKPYTIPGLVKIIDGWSTTGKRPLAGHR